MGKNGVCDFVARPSLDARDTSIFWLPAEDTGSVVLAAAPEVLQANAGFPRLDLSASSDSPGEVHIKQALGNGEDVHVVAPATLTSGQPAVALVPLNIDGFDRIEGILRLLSVLHGRKTPPDTRMTRQQTARARRMLQAVDGFKSGASQREIAEAVFRRVPQGRHEWQAASERFAVMDLIKDSLAMIAGGYRKLLRHRRRR